MDVAEKLAQALRLARGYMSDAVDYGTPCAKRDAELVDDALAEYKAVRTQPASGADVWRPIETVPPAAGWYLVGDAEFQAVREARWLPRSRAWKFPSAQHGLARVTHWTDMLAAPQLTDDR